MANQSIYDAFSRAHEHTIAKIGDVITQVNGKQDTITGGASTITGSNLTANRALISNGSGKVAVSTTTSTELGYLSGTTGNIENRFVSNERLYMALTPIKATFINANSDLNTTEFLKVGTYHCYYGAEVLTLTNCPAKESFMMRVYSPIYKTIDDELTSSNTNVHRIREILTIAGKEYIQYATKSNNTWSYEPWRQKYTSGNLTGAVSTITTSNLTENRVLISDADGKVAVSAVTSTELGYLDGVTSAIQTQLNGKLSTSGTAVKATADASGHTITRFYDSLIPAVNATSIPENADLNSIDYLKVGFYKCSNNTTVSTLLNTPENSAFVMSVISPISISYDNETTGTYVYRIRKLMTYQGHEYKQYVVSGSTAGSFTYGDWQMEYTSNNLKNAEEIVGLQNEIDNIDSQITYGSGNGWEYTIFPSNMIIMHKKTSVTVTSSSSSGEIYYSNSISDYFPSGIKVYNGSVSINNQENMMWSINAGIYAAANGIFYRLARPTAISTSTSYPVNYTVVGQLVEKTVETGDLNTTPISVAATGTLDGTSLWSTAKVNLVSVSGSVATFAYTLTAGTSSSSGHSSAGYEQYSVDLTISGSGLTTTTKNIVVKAKSTAWASGTTSARVTLTGNISVPVTGTLSTATIKNTFKTTSVSSTFNKSGTLSIYN